MAAFKGERKKERKKKKKSTGITNPGRSESESAGMADAEMASLKPWLFHVSQVSRARNVKNLRHFALFSES